MKYRTPHGLSISILCVAILALVGLYGCADTPSGPDPEPGTMVLTFGATEEGTAKVLALPGTGRTTSGNFDREGGALHIDVLEDEAEEPKVSVTFEVPKNSLSTEEFITMTVYGDEIPGLAVAFSPAGLTFRKGALLQIRIDKDRLDEKVLESDGSIIAFHHHDDGTIEEAVVLKSAFEDDHYVAVIQVPGFSRYSLGE